jgi:hypothetical protein
MHLQLGSQNLPGETEENTEKNVGCSFLFESTNFK